MMKPASTPAILAILAGAALATLAVGCRNDKVAAGPQHSGGQMSDANPAAGGASGGASSAGGAVANGGARTGGATGVGGAIGAGGASESGGNAKTGGSTSAGGAIGTGGANPSGGIIGSGGSGAGGDIKSDAGCAPGWTMCCGQCLSPQAGICAPCSGTGGTGQTGGALGTGGDAGTGGGGGGAVDAGACADGKIWCPGCMAGTGSCFTGGCPGVACPPPDAGTVDAASGTCGTLTTQAACDNRSDCHSVFVDPNNCKCSTAGCCAQFSRCANGGRANCNGNNGVCGAKTPYCAGPYVVSYTSTCFEGCVLQSECAGVDAAVTTPGCPQTAPASGSSCGATSLSCFYDNCPSTGRTQATCTAGTWSVQTAACGSVSCLGSPAVTTCQSGQLCLIVESGTIGVQCVSNTCGQGPISPACASGLAGCVVNATLNGGVTITCNQCPQGGCA